MVKGPILVALIAGAAAAQTGGEPVGLLLSVGADARIVRSTAPAGVPARVGEMLFAGDRLRSGRNPASYLFCPDRSSQVLDAQSEAAFDTRAVKVEKGKLTSKQQVEACFLPPGVQLSAASRQHAGGMVVRGAPSPLKLVSPVSEPVLDAAPRFSWRPLSRADAYQIEVANGSGDVVWKTETKETETQYPGHAPPLLAPSTYSWKITALAGGKPIAATASEFQMLRLGERRQIRQEIEGVQSALDRQPSNLGLRAAKAARLERAGLITQALVEYQALAPAWKEASWLNAKLADLADAVERAQRNALAVR